FQAGLVGGTPHVRYLASLGLSTGRCFVGCDVVDNSFFAEAAARLRGCVSRLSDGPVLLSCLRFLPRKNVLGVLEVLRDNPSDWTWAIAGDGPLRPDIERAIATYGLASKVRLLGHVSYADLPRIH